MRPLLLLLVLLSLAAPVQAEDPPQFLAGFRDDYPAWPEPSDAVVDVAVHPSGDLFVVDAQTCRVTRFHPDGEYVLSWGGPGSGYYEFSNPNGISLDELGQVHVADTGNNRIMVYSDQGVHLQWINAVAPFAAERLLGDRDCWLVTSHTNATVQAIDEWGAVLVHYFPEGSHLNQWDDPSDVVYDEFRDRLYVSEKQRDRIHIFPYIAGPGVFELIEGGPTLPDLMGPHGLGLDAAGNLFVACAGSGMILKFDPEGALLSTTAGYRPAAGLEIYGYGTIHVATGGRELYRYGYPPTLVSLQDIPADQGGWMRLQWTPSALDAQGLLLAIGSYTVYRRQPGMAKGMENWDVLGTVIARRDLLYSFVAPTLVDSTAADGIQWSVFRVTAYTDLGELFDCIPDSGYSVDNLAPAIPSAPAVWENAGLLELELSWAASAAPDFAWYGVYRGSTPGFVVGDLHAPYATTIIPGYVDDAVAPGETWYYRVAAFDDAGMVAGVSPSAGAQVLTEAPTPRLDRVVLLQNVPNPFNPSTRLRFHLPQAGKVELVVYDASGRRVATPLREPRPEGWQSFDWTARDDQGAMLSSGVYYAVLRTAEGSETRKMVLGK